jgi:hypothetical protein
LNTRYSACRPIDQVRAAAERIESSPVYPLILYHILRLSSDLDRIPAGPALAMCRLPR